MLNMYQPNQPPPTRLRVLPHIPIEHFGTETLPSNKTDVPLTSDFNLGTILIRERAFRTKTRYKIRYTIRYKGESAVQFLPLLYIYCN